MMEQSLGQLGGEGGVQSVFLSLGEIIIVRRWPGILIVREL